MSSFEKAARDFIATRGPGTQQLYAGDLDRWLVYCAESGVDAAEPTPGHAAAFRDGLKTRRGEAMGPLTVRRILSALCRIYRAAMSSWPPAAKWNPFTEDALHRPPPSSFCKTESMSKGQAEALIAEAAKEPDWGARDAAILTMIYETGLRVSAVATLRRDKLLEHEGTLLARVRTKHKDEVDVELTKRAAEALDRWLRVAPTSRYVFPSSDDPSEPITRQAISARFSVYGNRAGIPNAHPHRFRTAFITNAIDAGVPLTDVQAAVHHSTPTMTSRYDRGARGRGVTSAVAKFRDTRASEESK